jgi:cardiolipin synthase
MVEWSIFNEIFAVAFNVLYFVIIIGTIFIVILDNRNPVKTMAWVLVLFFLPIVGLVFYFFFGRSTRKEKLISKKGFTRLIKRPMAEYQAQKAFKCPDEQHQLMRFFRKVNNALPFEGNATEVFTDGYSMLYSLMKEISKAKHHIHLQFYIFEDDPAGRLLRDLLIDKARQGVEVRLLYDDVGCWKVPHAFFDEMRGAGIEARSFLKVRFPLFTSKVNYRNHRKIVVIDGRVAYTGGMNIALRYMKGFPWGIWRDTHIKIEGKAVYGLQTAFLTDWYVVDRTLITSSRYFPEVGIFGKALIQIMADLSDAVIALPGGCGTLEELLEIITWKQLGLYLNPIVILNVNGFFDPLLEMLEKAIDENFMRRQHGDIWKVAQMPEEAVELLYSTPVWDISIRKFAAI